jgi:NTP pyrophosphatase (non-canonical NTP hydrolase)
MEDITFPELSIAVGEWSKRNFGDKQDSYTGMVEELGELARCFIKRFQGIRGYDSPVYFRTQFIDALGDICIYTANFASYNGIKSEWPNIEGKASSVRYQVYLGRACHWLSHLMETPEHKIDMDRWLHNFLIEIAFLASLEGLDLKEVANETWQSVVVRDWNKNKTDGAI